MGLLSDGGVLLALSPVVFGSWMAFLDTLRVGRSVHLRFLPAHRLQGNFLSHFVLVLAQLLQAMGVRPAPLIMPWLGGKPS